ncbi:MAG: hypothetical protein HY600_04260 [Candidatus Omnitrophica bacterium]|nr:hypothetical protein [Candidatus Omnitrophota bacterium]
MMIAGWSRTLLCVTAVSLVLGCARSTPPPRKLKGQLEFEQAKPPRTAIKTTPPFAVVEKEGVEITIRYASEKELDNFFSNKVIFGKYAGKNPYPEGTLVFYVRVANKSGHRIRTAPDDFVLIDDLSIQYVHLSPDDISAMYETHGDFWAFAKSTGDLAPGYYGAPFKVAGSLADGGPRRANYLIRQARLTGGYVFDQVTYDGYVAFPRPHPNAKKLRVILANVKTALDAADQPTASLDFEFDFTLTVVPDAT